MPRKYKTDEVVDEQPQNKDTIKKLYNNPQFKEEADRNYYIISEAEKAKRYASYYRKLKEDSMRRQINQQREAELGIRNLELLEHFGGVVDYDKETEEAIDWVLLTACIIFFIIALIFIILYIRKKDINIDIHELREVDRNILNKK